MGRVDSAEFFADEIKAKADGTIDIHELQVGLISLSLSLCVCATLTLAELQVGFRRMGEHLSDADARAFVSLAASSADGSIDPATFTQVSRLSRRLTEGLRSCAERLAAEVVARSASVSSAVAQLRADAAAMLEERVEPCEQKIGQLRADTSRSLSLSVSVFLPLFLPLPFPLLLSLSLSLPLPLCLSLSLCLSFFRPPSARV
jgi:hypothetical protein